MKDCLTDRSQTNQKFVAGVPIRALLKDPLILRSHYFCNFPSNEAYGIPLERL